MHRVRWTFRLLPFDGELRGEEAGARATAGSGFVAGAGSSRLRAFATAGAVWARAESSCECSGLNPKSRSLPMVSGAPRLKFSGGSCTSSSDSWLRPAAGEQ
jgi:hypothetical protein